MPEDQKRKEREGMGEGRFNVISCSLKPFEPFEPLASQERRTVKLFLYTEIRFIKFDSDGGCE